MIAVTTNPLVTSGVCEMMAWRLVRGLLTFDRWLVPCFSINTTIIRYCASICLCVIMSVLQLEVVGVYKQGSFLLGEKHGLVIVSNRLPVSVKKVDGKLEYHASSGGLATAMQSIEGERLWVGWPGIVSEQLTAKDKAEITKQLKKNNFVPVFLSQDQVDNFYTGYSNDTIWPLFHYFQSYANYEKTFWQSYQEVNEAYASVLESVASVTAGIWIHDYHLMLLPKMIRKRLPKSTIGFFLHIPFPSFEIFRLLPNRKQVLEGLLGADVVGFHVYDYARHFLSSVYRVLGHESNHGSITIGRRIVKVDAFPIGIDYSRWVKALADKKVRAERRILDKHYEGQKIILSVDRLDYSKGIKNRLVAFDQFLHENPKYRKKVVLVVIAVPSRTDVDTYKELRDDIERTVGRINGAHGTVDWTPISYQFKNLPFEELAALYERSDIALLTPLRDGMNLVAKEFVATKQKNPGVLILSEMTGAVDEMPEAVRINPNDTTAIVEALTLALTMPQAEQKTRIESMHRRLQRYTVQRWAKDFMEQMERSKFRFARRGSKLLNDQTETRIIRSAVNAKKRLILLDYDGTLRNFVPSYNPVDAKPPASLNKLINQLTKLPDTLVCIVSGRPRAALELWFKRSAVALAAEHGAWMRYDGEWSQQAASLHDYRDRITPVLEHYLDRTPGASIEHKDFSIVWHYRGVPVELAHARNESLEYELNLLLASSDIGVYRGNKIIEIKPKNVQKSVIAEDLLAMHQPDFVLCIGDDYTDEDMFHALPEEAFTIKVGLGETAARFQVATVEDVLALLSSVAATKTSAK